MGIFTTIGDVFKRASSFVGDVFNKGVQRIGDIEDAVNKSWNKFTSDNMLEQRIEAALGTMKDKILDAPIIKKLNNFFDAKNLT